MMSAVKFRKTYLEAGSVYISLKLHSRVASSHSKVELSGLSCRCIACLLARAVWFCPDILGKYLISIEDKDGKRLTCFRLPVLGGGGENVERVSESNFAWFISAYSRRASRHCVTTVSPLRSPVKPSAHVHLLHLHHTFIPLPTLSE